MVTAVFTRPPDLPDSRISGLVQSAWPLAVDSIEYFPVGFGSHHWLVTVEGRRWFVTVDVMAPKSEGPLGRPDAVQRLEAALSTAGLLHDLGLHFVVAPIATAEGDLLIPIGDRYLVALYPYVEGTTFGWGLFGDRASRMAVLDRLVTLHMAPPHARRNAVADDFQIPCRNQLAEALSDTSNQWNNGVYAKPTRRLISRNERLINEWLARYDGLVSDVADRPERAVITHGEPHRANTIVTSDGVLLVDWDTALIAPPERDLWWLAREDAAILDEYEQRATTRVDLAALDLYRLRWDLADIALFTAQLHGPHDDDQDTRTAWEALAAYLDVT